jgi:hypothetical protein
MNAIFRHLTVRLWLTTLVGSWFCLVLLPWWQMGFGLSWLALPAGLIFSACFAAAGWAMSRIGTALAMRQVNEGAVWERAGMIREAENAFRRSAAFFDSFWLSPVFRRRHTQRLSGVLARFYLSHFAGHAYTRKMLAAYLKNYPQDQAVAESWLEGLVSYEQCSDQEHETAGRIGDALANNKPIQRLLLQFYLANGRVDFQAQQTYRRVWKEQQPLADEVVRELARLLRNESIVNPWALQVFLKAYQSGETSVLDGIAAGLRLLPIGEENRGDLAAARQVVTHLSAEQKEQLGGRFRPLDDEPVEEMQAQAEPAERMRSAWDDLQRHGLRAAGWTRSAVAKLPGRSIALRRMLSQVLKLRYLWYALGLAGAGVLLTLLVVLVRPTPEPATPETSATAPVQVQPVVADPFTIQVAAYMKVQDAQAFVDQLIANKLDAFWTKATSAHRTWYQVKISHFATREAAHRFGQDLKARGLIDDFYVANYETAAKSPQ